MNTLITAIVGVTCAIVGSYFSSRWATLRTYKERWWERKQKAYTDIIEALYDLRSVSESKFYEIVTGVDLDENENKKLERKRAQAYLLVSKSIDLGTFTISADAIEALRELRRKIGEISAADHAASIRDQEVGIFKDTIDDVVRCAKRDLKI